MGCPVPAWLQLTSQGKPCCWVGIAGTDPVGTQAQGDGYMGCRSHGDAGISWLDWAVQALPHRPQLCVCKRCTFGLWLPLQ